jgi:ribosomal protein S18 acetylase RimI-like enzyme
MKPIPPQPFRIRPMKASEAGVVRDLARSLSQFFPVDFISVIDESVKKHPCLVGLLGDEIVGFIVWTLRDTETAEILWMGIKEDYHGLGLGSMLLDSLEQSMGQKGVTKLVVSTLSYTVDYKPYEKVRAFYYNRGFKSLGIQSDYYYDGVDRLILVKMIG